MVEALFDQVFVMIWCPKIGLNINFSHEYCHGTSLYQIAALCSDGSSALKVLSTSLQKTAEIDRTNMARYFVITYTITLHLVSKVIIEKSRVEVPLTEQDTIENVS